MKLRKFPPVSLMSPDKITQHLQSLLMGYNKNFGIMLLVRTIKKNNIPRL